MDSIEQKLKDLKTQSEAMRETCNRAREGVKALIEELNAMKFRVPATIAPDGDNGYLFCFDRGTSGKPWTIYWQAPGKTERHSFTTGSESPTAECVVKMYESRGKLLDAIGDAMLAKARSLDASLNEQIQTRKVH